MFCSVETARAVCARVIVYLILIYALPVTASPADQARAWLLEQQREDGAFAGVHDIATAEQATSETLLAVGIDGETRERALAFLQSTPLETQPTEYLARLLLASGGQHVAARNELLARQNLDGGFGAQRGHAGNVLDTAYALRALAGVAGVADQVGGFGVTWLMSRQSANGAWPGLNGTSSSFVTAHAMTALWSYRQRFSVDAVVSNARNYLLAIRDDAPLWPELHESALILAQIAPTLTENEVLDGAAAALVQEQHSNGYWRDDAYITALSLSALKSLEQGYADRSHVIGRIIDGEAETGIAGASVSLAGPLAATGFTDTQGHFHISLDQPGIYSLRVEATGYPELEANVTVRAGETTNVGTVRLLRDTGSLTATLQGTVYDAGNNMPLAAATVSIEGRAATTSSDVNGQYLLADLDTGTVTITISKSGYQSATASGSLVAGGVLLFSPALHPVVSPTFSLVGEIHDAASGAPLVGASITVSGAATASTTSGAGGLYELTGLEPGAVTIVVRHEGYEPISRTLDAGPNQRIAFSPALQPVSEEDPPAELEITGRVVDQLSGAALAVVGIEIIHDGGAANTSTGNDGDFAIVVPSSAQLHATFSLPGYESASTTLDTEGFRRIELNVSMSAENEPRSRLIGVVIDGESGHPLGDVELVLQQESGERDFLTDEDGAFDFIDLQPGPATLHVTATGYFARTISIELPDARYLDMGQLSMQPEAATDPVELSGKVLDSTTNEPLVNAEVTGVFRGVPQTVLTDADGLFILAGYPNESGDLSVRADGYVSVELTLFVDPENTELGHIRLRPAGVGAMHPDIVLALHDLSARETDPATLVVSGKVVLEVANIGRYAVEREFDVVAFRDVNGNGRFDSEVDIELGRTVHNGGLAPDAMGLIEIELHGSLPFRDAPIHFAADPDNHIIEVRDDNNFVATLDACRIRPERGEFNPVEKWRWSGGRVTSTPMVAPLMDTNGDGRVDQDDDPFVVFIASNGFPDNAPGYVVAVNGRTGIEAWRYAGPVHAASSVAVGDLDGDGYTQVVALKYSTGLVILNGDGSLKHEGQYPDIWVRYQYGAPYLVDLDGDGYSEIVAHQFVLNHDASLRTRISAPSTEFKSVTVADLNRDDRYELIYGGRIYSDTGELLHDFSGPGHVGIGNFNDDPDPELVLVRSGNVYLYSNKGELIWGPVRIASRLGGSPTIGDVDGDGIPEIGVAGDRAYWVLNADGSIRWSASASDGSAGTGSTFFDFDGDNRVEVVYFDERRLRIFDGADGKTLFSVNNPSVTAWEYPVVADVNGDSHADLVVPSYDSAMGIRVFSDKNNTWVNTRGIWNQHAYSITNVKDNGSIPKAVPRNWETFNNYRVNAVPDPTRVADLTVSLFTLQDKGPGQPLKATLRVGNGGGFDARNIAVTIHTAHPDFGGVKWAETTVSLLPAADFVDIELDGSNLLSDPLTLYVEVNSSGSVPECFTHNNGMTLPSIPVVGAIDVTPDASTYPPETDTLFTAVAHNTGSFTRAFEAQLRIEDGNGNIVVEFPRRALGEIASGGQALVQESWNTARYLAGNYRLRGNLYSVDDELLASSTAPFEIRHDATGEPLAALRLATDRPRYHTTDAVRFDLLAQNRSLSTSLHASSIRLAVSDPVGETAFDQTLPVRELAAGNHESLFATQGLSAAPIGDYQATASWRNSEGVLLAATQTNFEVHEDLAVALQGMVTVASPQVYIGDAQLCTEQVTNTGSMTANVNLRRTVARIDQPTAEVGAPFSASIASGASQTWTRGIDTAALVEGDYACVIEAEINNAWQPLANAIFRLVPPPIRIDATMQTSERGRLLVLLDPACADRDPPESAGHACDAEPYGPADAPPLPIQREHLEAVLDAAGWTYSIVTNAADFETAFRSKGYELYALFNEVVKLPEALQRDVVVDIATGRGLFVAGNHDRRNGRIETALGIQSLGKNLDVEALQVEPLGDHDGGELQFFVLQRPNAIRLDGADVIGEYRLAPIGTKQPDNEPAITRHEHERGTGIYAGFDWPVQSATEGDDGEFANLLVATLGAAHPHPYSPVAGRTFPLTVLLVNEGMATPGQVHLALPSGTSLVEGPPGTVVTDDIAAWTFTLAEDEQQAFTVWLQLPDTAGPLTLEAAILTGEGDELTEHTRAQIVLNVQAE